MNTTPSAVATRVSVRAINFDLDEPLRMHVTERATRLLRHSATIHDVCIELEDDVTRDPAHEFVAKGRIDFGGPALLASVTGADAETTLDYLLEQLEHRLRRQRRSRPPQPIDA